MPVPLGLYITSQIFGLFGLVCVFVAFQFKSKTVTLLLMLVCNIFATAGAAFLTDWVAMAMGMVGMLRCLTFYLTEKYRERINRWFSFVILVALLAACCISVAVTWEWWFDFVLLGAWLLFIYGTWAKGINRIRIFGIAYSVLLIVHLAFFMNYMAIATEATAIASVLLFYLKQLRHRIGERNSLGQ
ncbi:MAG: YgjV family protein [Christensenellaceae bacterium]|jgi:hypothetical protein|nr:YgjV family protein [Christensenellaceae bacterium]